MIINHFLSGYLILLPPELKPLQLPPLEAAASALQRGLNAKPKKRAKKVKKGDEPETSPATTAGS